MRLSGQTAFVTGGGTGIGAAIARRLVSEGATVAVAGRRAGPLGEVAKEIGAHAVVGDVASGGEVRRMVTEAVARLGALDIVVNNAGVGSTDWETTLAVNLTAAHHVAEECVPYLVERSGGTIVNVASVAGIVAHRDGAAYSASKAGLIMLTRSLALDYGPRGIRVNALCPGWVRTPMGDQAMDELAEKRGISRDEAYALATHESPLGRVGEPEEIAAACAFLVSEDASFVSGAVLVADGGATVVDVSHLAFGR